MATVPQSTTPADPFEKEINYDRLTKDYKLSLGGQIVGYARTYSEGETVLNELVHAKLTHTAPPAA